MAIVLTSLEYGEEWGVCIVIIPLLMAIFNIAIAGLQIYIIGELASFM